MKLFIVTIIFMTGCTTPYYPQRIALRPIYTPVSVPVEQEVIPCVKETPMENMMKYEIMQELGKSNRPYQYPINQRDFYTPDYLAF